MERAGNSGSHVSILIITRHHHCHSKRVTTERRRRQRCLLHSAILAKPRHHALLPVSTRPATLRLGVSIGCEFAVHIYALLVLLDLLFSAYDNNSDGGGGGGEEEEERREAC